jgi:hypothetical protein
MSAPFDLALGLLLTDSNRRLLPWGTGQDIQHIAVLRKEGEPQSGPADLLWGLPGDQAAGKAPLVLADNSRFLQ